VPDRAHQIPEADLAGLLPRVALAADPARAVRDCTSVPAALTALQSGGFLLEAARLVAHALPKREAVWWACMCALHTEPGDLGEQDREAREAAELWVRKQSDDVRRTAMDRAQATEFGTAEAWAGVAAFWSGDSMAPKGQPAVPPAPHLTGTAVAGAVALAAVRGDVTRRERRLHRFLESACDIAAGGPGRLPAEEP